MPGPDQPELHAGRVGGGGGDGGLTHGETGETWHHQPGSEVGGGVDVGFGFRVRIGKEDRVTAARATFRYGDLIEMPVVASIPPPPIIATMR